MTSTTPQDPNAEIQPEWLPGDTPDPQAEPVFTALVEEIVTDQVELDA